MDIYTVTRFFMWCTIINGGVLLLWTALGVLAQDWVYRTQSRWFPIPRDTFVVVFYCFIGLFKIGFLMFNLVPYIVLLILK